MSVSSALHRSNRQPTWAWLAIGVFVLVAVLVLFVLPRRSNGDEVERAPSVLPQSDTRPMPPPSVARMRGLAA